MTNERLADTQRVGLFKVKTRAFRHFKKIGEQRQPVVECFSCSYPLIHPFEIYDVTIHGEFLCKACAEELLEEEEDE